MFSLDRVRITRTFNIFIFFVCITSGVNADTVTPVQITYNPAEISNGFWDRELLELALEKTREKYGPYELKESIPLPLGDRVSYMQRNLQPNFVAVLGYNAARDAEKNLDYVAVPVDQGILGWRICFVNQKKKAQVAAASKSVEELRHFSIVQGSHWIDNSILRANGFRVMEVDARADNLVQMVASGRADMYCRGITELPVEWTKYQKMNNLSYDESFVLVYDMPMFFYLNKSNAAMKKRLEEGLIMAHRDGSLQKVWAAHYNHFVDFANINQRAIIRLQTPDNKNLAANYSNFLIDPLAYKHPSLAYTQVP